MKQQKTEVAPDIALKNEEAPIVPANEEADEITDDSDSDDFEARLKAPIAEEPPEEHKEPTNEEAINKQAIYNIETL